MIDIGLEDDLSQMVVPHTSFTINTVHNLAIQAQPQIQVADQGTWFRWNKEERGLLKKTSCRQLCGKWQLGFEKYVARKQKRKESVKQNISKTDKTARKILEMISAKNIPHGYAE